MQSKIVTLVDLKKEFATQYKIPDYMMSFNQNDIINGVKVNFNLVESFSGLPVDNLHHSSTPDLSAYKKVCVDEMRRYLQATDESINTQILSIKNNFFERFFQRTNLKKLQSASNDIIAALDKENFIENLVEFTITELPEDVKIPFFKLNKGQLIFLVIQDPVSYMKIVKATVTDIHLVHTTTDQMTNCDYEYTYLLDTVAENKTISYNQFRKFDGHKCLINYNYALFVNLDEAKEHSIKVLEGIKNNVNMKIKDIEDFTV